MVWFKINILICEVYVRINIECFKTSTQYYRGEMCLPHTPGGNAFLCHWVGFGARRRGSTTESKHWMERGKEGNGQVAKRTNRRRGARER